MANRVFNVLFLCTGNSARSVIAEALLNVLGKGRFRAFSAGSHPSGMIQPLAAELAATIGYETANLRSKSWGEFAQPGSPRMDLVITVCDNAAGEACPAWLGGPTTAHWGVDDPAAVQGDEDRRRHAYMEAFSVLRRRVELLVALPLDKLGRLAAQQQVRAIAADGSGLSAPAGDVEATVTPMGGFERYLSLWVALCIVAGIVLGRGLPDVFATIGRAEIAQVNLPVAALVWLMIVPMLMKIDFAALHDVRQHWKGSGVTLFINWAVKPFSMAFLGWLFIAVLFRPLLPAAQAESYIAGLILLAAAPCTAMVFVWSGLCRGEPHFTLTQVALNDAIMLVAFAPIVGLLLGLSAITVPYRTLLLSVGLYIVVPIIIAQLLRRALSLRGGQAAVDALLRRLGPLSLLALLATLVLLFGFQGEMIVRQPLVIALLAVPILIQVYFNAGLAYWLNRRFGVAHCVAGPSALIGASNFFELAVATAIGLFGLKSGAALATVVGVLVEVPVMLSVVRIVNRSREWYERGALNQRA